MPDNRPRTPQSEANRLTTLLNRTLGQDRFPVDVEMVARELSRNNPDPIRKIEGFDLPGFEGTLRAHRKIPGWHIVYNDDLRYRGRVRFTLAHEFGHYQLHRPVLTDQNYVNGSLTSPSDFSCRPLRQHEWTHSEQKREREADTFASFLLMPLDDFRMQIGGQEMTGELLQHVTNRYGVSLTAACLRWIEFSDRRVAMLVSRDGRALWGRASKSAYNTGIFISSGMEIPEKSQTALSVGKQGFTTGRPMDTQAGVWHFGGRTELVRELVSVSELLDQSITILQFDDAPTNMDHEEEEPWDAYDQITAH